jgi:hypothetical protein
LMVDGVMVIGNMLETKGFEEKFAAIMRAL